MKSGIKMKRLFGKIAVAVAASDTGPSKGDIHSLALVVVIACLFFAILLLRAPDPAMLTPEPIYLLPPWG